jgi:hypothetical protein
LVAGTSAGDRQRIGIEEGTSKRARFGDVILEIGVEPVAPCRAQGVHQPGHLVVDECQDLTNDPMANEPQPLRLAIHHLLQDQQVPLFVVLLEPAHTDLVEDPPGEVMLPAVWVMATYATFSQA